MPRLRVKHSQCEITKPCAGSGEASALVQAMRALPQHQQLVLCAASKLLGQSQAGTKAMAQAPGTPQSISKVRIERKKVCLRLKIHWGSSFLVSHCHSVLTLKMKAGIVKCALVLVAEFSWSTWRILEVHIASLQMPKTLALQYWYCTQQN